MLRRNLEDLSENGLIGDWCFTPDNCHMFLRYPCRNPFFGDDANRGDIVSLPVHEGSDGQGWQWDGNKEAPTLSPSINVIGQWHGFLKAGKIETC